MASLWRRCNSRTMQNQLSSLWLSGEVPMMASCIHQRGAKATSKADKKAEAKAQEARGDASIGSKIQPLLKVLEPHDIPKQKLSPEDLAEHKRIAKEYSRNKIKQHRQWQKRMSTILQLKLAAIEALPAELQDHANTPDYADFPTNRWIPTHTPPLDGYSDARGDQEASNRHR